MNLEVRGLSRPFGGLRVRSCGRPRSRRTRKSKAFIVPHEGYQGSDEPVKELQESVKSRIPPYKCPRIVEFVDELPKTATGKFQRFCPRDQ